MKRKLFGMLLSLVLILACLVLLPSRAQAAETVASGSCGQNVTWTLDNEGLLTISGSGRMTDFHIETAPWYSYADGIKKIVIQQGVTGVGAWSFYNCANLQEVYLPESIERIGNRAFRGCASLQSIDLPMCLSGLENETFMGCSSLQEITLNFNDYGSIAPSAFEDCINLESVTIHGNVTFIWEYAFEGCSNLQTIIIPDGCIEIGRCAFAGCSSLTNCTIPESVMTIGEGAFARCSSIQNIVIPDGVTSIGDSAFLYCSSLRSIKIPDSVTKISADAFNGCSSLQSVVIPDGVTSIESFAFCGCTSLQNVTIPGTVTRIGDFSFHQCNSLKSIIIPDGVTSLDYVFQGCSGLQEVIIPDSVISMNYAFGDCTSLESISVPNSAASMEGAFYGCIALRSFEIPDGATKIGDSMFERCTGLQVIAIPESVTIIEENALNGCEALTDVYYEGSNIKWGEIEVQSDNDPLFSATIHYQMPAADILLKEMVDYNVPIETIRETVQSMDSQELAEAMKTDSEAVENLAALEDKVGGGADVVVENTSVGIAAQGAQIVGANLNNVTGGQSAALVIDMAERNNQIPESYETNTAVQFSMTLENVENTEKLDVPVMITLPIPEELNPDRLVVVHYHGAGTEVVEPIIEEVDGKYYASIVVEGFSDFAMVQKKHVYSHQYDYKCDICGTERIVDMTRPMVDMHRMYNPNTGEHFYTGSIEERDNLIGHGWQYEGVGFTFPLTTGKPVHRLFQPSTGEHLYTMDEAEKDKLMAEGWNYEGIAFNSGFENEVPQYRLHNPNATVGAYHFTASEIEKSNLIAAGWEYQGIGWYSLGAM